MFATKVDVKSMLLRGVKSINIQRETGKAYTLDKFYRVVDELVELPIGWTPNWIEMQRDWSHTQTPDWARDSNGAGLTGFDCYWLY